MHGQIWVQTQESSLSCGCTHGWPYTADAATVPSREAAQGPVGMADCVILFDGWPHTADAATVPSRKAAQGLVDMADCLMNPAITIID